MAISLFLDILFCKKMAVQIFLETVIPIFFGFLVLIWHQKKNFADFPQKILGKISPEQWQLCSLNQPISLEQKTLD